MELREHLQKTLRDSYTLEQELGGGGMSRVFVATEQALGRQVVVKVLPTETAGHVSTERFRREIRLAASLQQANIVPVLSAGDAGGVAYYTMPFVKGESLRTRLATKGALPIAECVAILRDVARALAFAHAEGVVHRDIKPENILLSGGTAVVTDFGIAKALAASSTQPSAPTLTHLGIAVGTPAYMAPEQVVGETIDHRADLYALGVVAYELLTGAAPFVGRSAQAMLAAHVTEAPVPIARRRADVPPRLADLVMRCLAKELHERPESASVILEELETSGPRSSSPSLAGPRERSLAVLPLINLSSDPENEYFSDGLAEEFINSLGRLPGLRVTARTSAFAMKGAQRDVREIGRTLGVEAILEGSVRRSGDRLRISVQLIDVSSGHQLWSARFDRAMQDVFALQDELSSIVADQLKIELAIDRRDARGGGTTNVVAYDAYLRARFAFAKGSREACERAYTLFERAAQLDPAFARAYDGMAQALIYSVVAGAEALERFPIARRHVARALELEPQLADAHGTDAYLTFWFDWDWERMERVFLHALDLDPGSAFTRMAYAISLTNLGRSDEAIEHARRVISIDPLWAHGHQTLGFALQYSGRPQEAIAACDRALELSPDHLPAAWTRVMAFLARGDLQTALASTERELSRLPGHPWWLSQLALVNAQLGRANDAKAIATELREHARREFVHPISLVIAYAAAGAFDEAFAAMEQAITRRDANVVGLPTYVGFDSLRGDPRFDDILNRLKFPRWSLAVAAERQRRAVATFSRPAAPSLAAQHAVAVLPLTNMSANADDEYFSDGVTEDIIAQLARIASLKVISRASVTRFKTTQKSAREIASELGVSHLVTGSVRRAGQKLRIVAQLLDARSDDHLWAETYDRELTDIFATQSEIAMSVAGALRAKLTPDERERIEHQPTANLDAYNAYLLGRFQLARRSAESLERAIMHFQSAIDFDPSYAAPHAGLADAYTLRSIGYGVAPAGSMPVAKAMAARAVALNDSLAEGHTALGYVQAWFDWDVDAAGHSFQRAIELNPSHAQAHQWIAQVHFVRGDDQEHLRAITRARDLDPLSVLITCEAGWPFFVTGQYERAAEQFRRALAMDPDFGLAHFDLGWCYDYQGLLEEAIVEYERALPLTGGSAFVVAWLARLLAKTGRVADAELHATALRERAARGEPIQVYLALVLDALGRIDEALDAFEYAIVARQPYVFQAKLRPSTFPLENIVRYLRFAELLERIRAIGDRP